MVFLLIFRTENIFLFSHNHNSSYLLFNLFSDSKIIVFIIQEISILILLYSNISFKFILNYKYSSI